MNMHCVQWRVVYLKAWPSRSMGQCKAEVPLGDVCSVTAAGRLREERFAESLQHTHAMV